MISGMLEREEYVEQAYFFRALRERMLQSMSTQDLLAALKHEVLATTRLPMAIDYMEVELRHSGGFAPAMARLAHYFTPFQAYVIREAERDGGRFDFRVAMEILRREADYRVQGVTPQGVFVYQFETLCRNRLGYDAGLAAMAGDPMFDEDWREWILMVRRQMGIVDFADLIYVRSEHYRDCRDEPDAPDPFRPQGRAKSPWPIAAKIPCYFSPPCSGTWVTQRPAPGRRRAQRSIIPLLQRRVERLEQRIQAPGRGISRRHQSGKVLCGQGKRGPCARGRRENRCRRQAPFCTCNTLGGGSTSPAGGGGRFDPAAGRCV